MIQYFKKGRRKWIALGLTFAIAFTTVSWEMLRKEKAKARENETSSEYYDESALMKMFDTEDFNEKEMVELKDERTTNSTTYDMGNGFKKVVYYSSDVRFNDDDGKLSDYDSSLKQSKVTRERNSYKYESSVGDTKNYIPRNIEKTPVLMENDNYSIELSPVFKGAIFSRKSDDNEFNNINSMSDVNEIKETYEDIYDKEKTSIVGGEYVSKDKKIKLEYISSDKGIKENIVLYSKPQNNVWKFKLSLNTLVPKKDESTGSIYIYDGDKMVGEIEKPYMNDASNEAYSEDISYNITSCDRQGEYELSMTVDKQYLDASDRQYPITIDPTITWTGSNNIDDVYVINGKYRETNFYSDSVKVLAAGDGKQGVYRSFINITDLKKKISGYSIANAKYTVFEADGGAKGQCVEAYRVKEAYDKKKITWANKPAYDTKLISSIVTTGKAKHSSTFDLTAYVRGVAKGSSENYGVMLKAKNDDKSSAFTKFFSSRNATAQYRPKLEVIYYDKPTTPTAVNLNKRFFKQGEKITVSWNGINSQALSLVQYRLAKYDLAKNEENGNIIDYSMDTKIGESSAGSKTIDVSKSWAEGEYKLVVRGYDKFKMAGMGKGITFVIDGVKPKLGDVSITESSKDKYSTALPTIKWSGVSDKYFKCVEYSINNSNYIPLGKTGNGEVTLSNSVINTPGEYTIKVRAIDKSGNVSDEKQLKYYYDSKLPEITTFTTVPVEKGATKTPMLVWNVDDNNIKSIEYSINGGDYASIGTLNSGAYTIEEGKIVEQGTYTIKLRAIDTAGNVSVEKAIKYEYNEGVVNNEKITVVPSSSTENYTNTEPTIVLSYMNDLAKVKIAYVLKLNGDVVADKTVDVDVINGAASYTLNKELFNKSGDYSLDVKVIDEQNNTIEEVNKVYNYDTVQPEIKSARIINTSLQEVPTIELSGIQEDKSGISNKAVYSVVSSNVDTTEIKELDKVATATVDNKKVLFKLDEEVKQLEDGIYKVLVGIKDYAGNVSNIEEVGYYKINAKFEENNIEAAYNDKTSTIDVAWKADKNIKEVELYSRQPKDEFKLVNEIATTEEDSVISASIQDINTTVDYRVVFTYVDGSKKLSDIVSIEKSQDDDEDEDSDKKTEILYDETEVDEDEDGLEDGYELWDLSCNPNEKDSDGDGFDDIYEVTTLGTSPAVFTQDKDSDGDGLYDSKEYAVGTDPYLQDSDFDGISDSQDSKPTKTDIKSGKDIKYTQDVHIGLYDRKIETVAKDDKKTVTIENIYTGKIKQVNTDGDITSYYYDSNENNTVVIGKANNEYVVNTYSFDKDNNLTYLTHNGFGYEFNYDNDGNMTDIVAANRTLVSYKYKRSSQEGNDEEKEDVMSTMTYGNNYKYDYEYDDKDNVTAIKKDNKLAYEMTYDANNNMTKQVDKLNGITYEYEYDGEGNVKSVKGSDGFNISYVNKKSETIEEDGDSVTKGEYGTGYIDGDLTRVCNTTTRENTTDKITQTTTLLIDKNTIEYVVNENSNTETKTIKDRDGNNLVYTITETDDDGNQEVRNINGDNLTYKYNENDNIISIESSDGSSVTYKYDELEQLVRENDSKAGTTTIYTYDKGGNITSQKVYAYTEGEVSGTPTKTKSYEYKDSNWRDLLTSYNGQSITYDEIGNPIQYRDGYNFTWTNGRSLKNVKKGDTSTSYKYNKDGIRTEKTVNGKKTKYQLEESNIVKETSEGQTIWYIYDGNGDLIGFELNGTSYYYDKNLQGDITGIYDTKGVKVVTYRYDAWGNIISMDGDEELAKKNPFRYRGYYYDEEIGLYYLNSRYYDAEVGRFVNEDDVNLIPTMQSGIKGTNLFEYSDSNPVNREDPTGQWSMRKVKNAIKKLYRRIKNFLNAHKILNLIVNAIVGGIIWDIIKPILPKAWGITKRMVKSGFTKVMTGVRWIWKTFTAGVKCIIRNWKVASGIIIFAIASGITYFICNKKLLKKCK